MEDDIEAEIRAAREALSKDEGGAKDVIETAPVVDKGGGEKTPEVKDDKPVEPTDEEKAAAKPREGEDDAARKARLEAEGRDEKGRFKSKPEGGEKAEKTAAAKDKGEKKAEADKPLQPPSHWDPEAKAAFLQAPRALQQQALKREEEISTKSKEWQGKAEDYNRIQKVIGPHVDRWAAMGRTPDVAIAQILAFEKFLREDATGGVVNLLTTYARGKEMSVIQKIAEANGYQLTKADNQGGSDKGQGARPQDDPTARQVEELSKELTDLKNSRKQNDDAEAARRAAFVQSEIQAVRTDPKNIYYDNLLPEIAALLKIGDDAGDRRDIKARVQEAYDNAVWSSPKTRPLMLESQEREREEARKKAEADKVAAAKRAGSSIAGSQAVEGQHVQRNDQTSNRNSYEDDVKQALRSFQRA